LFVPTSSMIGSVLCGSMPPPAVYRASFPMGKEPQKDPRKGRKAKEATDQWKNLGFWKDLSQLLSSYTREVLRKEIGGDDS